MNQYIEQLEIRIAFLEQANGQLSDELFRQRQELEALRIQLTNFMQRSETAQVATAYSAEQEKPPHY